MKQRTLERDLLSPKYRQRVVEAKKGKGSYKRVDVKKVVKSSYFKVLSLVA
jgi:stalled ribosome alternative rescue factor ArfA